MDLTTNYLGLELKNPIVASSSPLSRDIDGIRSLANAGVSAIVLPSLFEEQIEHEARMLDDYVDSRDYSNAEAMSYFPAYDAETLVPDEYVRRIRAAKAAVDIPIIGSLNGTSSGGWIRWARSIQEAGADAIELNLYYLSTDPDETSEHVERRYLSAARSVLSEVEIPVAVKIGPFLSALPHFARTLSREGVKGLILFNRFYQPDLDLDELEVLPGLNLSRSEDMRLPLRWTAILSGRVEIDLAISTGVHTHTDVLKGMMAGAQVTMMASELLKHGVGRVEEVLEETRQWMKVHEYESIKQMQGSMSQRHVADPESYERANYVKTLYSYHH